MQLWKIEHAPESLAAVEAATGRRKTYGELRHDVGQMFMPKQPQRALILLLAQNRYECLVTYLAALQSRNPLLLVEASLNRDLLLQLVNAYRPDYIYASPSDLSLPGYQMRQETRLNLWEKQGKEPVAIHDSLALLLNTSGSTGSPKLVRLSLENPQSSGASNSLSCTVKPKPQRGSHTFPSKALPKRLAPSELPFPTVRCMSTRIRESSCTAAQT